MSLIPAGIIKADERSHLVRVSSLKETKFKQKDEKVLYFDI